MYNRHVKFGLKILNRLGRGFDSHCFALGCVVTFCLFFLSNWPFFCGHHFCLQCIQCESKKSPP